MAHLLHLTCSLLFMTVVSVNCQLPDLQVEVLHPVETCARKTQKHDLVTMHYVGFLDNGTQFDSR